MKKKLIFTAFLIALAFQFFFPLKTIHDQYMAKKYGAVETCAVKLRWNYHSDSEIRIKPPENTKLEEFAVNNKELCKFVNENYDLLKAEAVMKVLGQTRVLEDVLVCGISMKNPPDNALETLKAQVEKIKEEFIKKANQDAAKKSEATEPPKTAAAETKPQPEAAPTENAAAPQEQKIDAPKQTPEAPAAQSETAPAQEQPTGASAQAQNSAEAEQGQPSPKEPQNK